MPGLARMDPTRSQPPVKHETSEVKCEGDDVDDFGDGESAEDENTYKPRPQLMEPGVFKRSLAYLIKCLDDGIIDVEPEYQRDVVWTAERMTGLINSLMENYYIPPIILNKKTLHCENSAFGPPKHTLVCVDGKQRLSSIKAFVKGMIPCHDHRGVKWWFCEGQTCRKVLPEETQRSFLEKEFVSFEYAHLSAEQEEDLFARVQMGMQLTLAERMRAQTGPWQELARLFVNDFPVIFSLMKDRTRAKDFQLALSCFSQIIEVQHPTAPNGVPILKTNYSSLPKLLENRGAIDDGLKSHLASVFNTFKDLIEEDPTTFTNQARTLKGVQTFAPIEMVAVTVLISMYSESRNNRLLLGDIKELRIALREEFVDLRMNTPVWKFIWNFLEYLEQIRGTVDGSTIDRCADTTPALPTHTQNLAPQSPATSTVVAPKRGRPTMRTKPATDVLGSGLEETPSASVPAETVSTTSIPDPRVPKRKRTDTVPAFPPTNIPQASDKIIVASQEPATTLPTSNTSPSIRPVVQMEARTGRVPPLRNSYHQNMSQQTARTSLGAQMMYNLESRALAQPSTRVQRVGNVSSSIPPSPSFGAASALSHLVTSAEPRQQRISELNSYREPISPVQGMPISPSVYSNGVPGTLPHHIAHPQPRPQRQPPPQLEHEPFVHWANFTEPRFAAAVRPPEQPQEVIRTISPQKPTASLPTPPAQQPRGKPPKHPLTQLDGTIDLTEDDVEQERQELLSSFGVHQTRPPPPAALSAVAQPPGRRQRPIVIEDSTDDESPGSNDPYQGLKQKKP